MYLSTHAGPRAGAPLPPRRPLPPHQSPSSARPQLRTAHQQPAPSAPKPPKLPTFESVRVEPVEQGNLLCFVDLRIGKGPAQFTVCKFRLIRPEGQPYIVLPPQEVWLDEISGKKRYRTLFTYPKPWREPLKAAVVAAWEAHQREKASAKQETGRVAE